MRHIKDSSPKLHPNRLGACLSKEARNKLTLLCIKSITQTIQSKPLGKINQRGRPPSPEVILAETLGVKQKTVHRWADPDQIQATDFNAEKIAEVAYGLSPTETTTILRSELSVYELVVDNWLDKMQEHEKQ